MAKSHGGTVYVRIHPDVHRNARVRALTVGITLSKLVQLALEQYLNLAPASTQETS